MLTHGFPALSVGRGRTEPGRLSSPLGEPEGYGPARRADGSPGEEGPPGTGAEGLPAAGRDRSYFCRCNTDTGIISVALLGFKAGKGWTRVTAR